MAGALQEGTIFAGRYRVVQCIASGGMATVYEVIHLGTERHRALKVMHPHLFESSEMRERFTREARITSAIHSEYLVEIFDSGIEEVTQMPFLVMELLQGEELGKRLKRVGRFAPLEVVTYLYQAALALDRTHQALIVHRDLKPRNLFLTVRDDGSPRLKILDFGIAKVLAEAATMTGATQTMGTPTYMPPEQFTGTNLTPAADIYALGMITYTMLVGEAYWHREVRELDNMIAFAIVAMKGPIDPASQRAAAQGVALPEGFDAWFKKALAVRPDDRFPKATEAVRALAEVFGVVLETVPISGRWTSSGTWSQPTPAAAMEGGAASSRTPAVLDRTALDRTALDRTAASSLNLPTRAEPRTGGEAFPGGTAAASQDQMATLIGTAIVPASQQRGMGTRPLLAALLAGGVLGVATLFVLRPTEDRAALKTESPVQAASAPIARKASEAPAGGVASAAATVTSASPESTSSARAAAAAPSAAMAAPSASAAMAAPSASTAPRGSTRQGVKPPSPAAGSRKPTATTTATPLRSLLGRD
jgi:serine/threonine-protein kinase